ncbi:MAG: hypothetical protein R3B57_11895 [Phycisphaerales bacterium]
MDTIPDLSGDEWSELTERLSLYATRKMSKLFWRGVPARRGGHAPGGIEPQDLASEAIVSVIDGSREWDPAAHPDFRRFLEGVIDSKVNHLAESADNRMTRREPVTTDGQIKELKTTRRNFESDPADLCCECDAADSFRQFVEKEIAGDDQLEQVFECLAAGIIRPREIAELLECEVTVINNIQKRLRRRVDKAMRRHAGRSTQ